MDTYYRPKQGPVSGFSHQQLRSAKKSDSIRRGSHSKFSMHCLVALLNRCIRLACGSLPISFHKQNSDHLYEFCGITILIIVGLLFKQSNKMMSTKRRPPISYVKRTGIWLARGCANYEEISSVLLKQYVGRDGNT